MKLSREDSLDLARFTLVVGGIAMLGYGSWLHYRPLGFVVAGAATLIVAAVAVWRKR